VQTVVTTTSDIRDTKNDYAVRADATTGFVVYEEGGVRLSGSGTTAIVENTVRLTGADITALVPPISATLDVGVVEWGGAQAESIELFSATAYLDPDTGAGQEVTTWFAAIFRLARASVVAGDEVWDLQWLGSDSVTAGGAAGDVTFTFARGQTVPVTGPAPDVEEALRPSTTPDQPATVLMVWALQGTGETAANAAWEADSGNTTMTDGSHSVTRYQLTQLDNNAELSTTTRYIASAPQSGVPTMSFGGNTYTSAVITWSAAGPGDGIDLGAAPGASTLLELVLEAAEPADTTVVGQVDDGVAGFTTFVDGDQIGVDRTAQGGTDLSGLLRQQLYDIRANVNTSADTSKTPRLFRIGVREVTLEDVDALAEFGAGAWAIDPITCASEIPTLDLLLHRDGVNDYRSWAEELFAANHLNDLLLRVWIGHPDLARRYWLHVDDFLVDTYAPTTLGVEVACVSPLQYVLANIPPKVTTVRSAIVYSGSTLKAVYDDIITGQVGVAARFIGPGIEDTSTTVTKTVRAKTQAIDVLREINFLNGSVLLSSQGRLKARPLFNEEPPEREAVFPLADTQILGIDAGHDRRITEFDVSFGFTSGEFAGEREHAASASVIANLGPTAVGQDAELDASTAEWIINSTHADVIGNRMVTLFATGMAQVRFRSATPRPWLEPGDPCSVEQDLYVGRDPSTGNGIRGRSWTRSMITQCHDVLGTEFTAWVQSWVPFLTSGTAITRTSMLVNLEGPATKTLTIPAAALVQGSTTAYSSGIGVAQPNVAATTVSLYAAVTLPPGVTIDSIRTRGARLNAADVCVARLAYETYTDTPPATSSTVLATNTHATDANLWTEQTASSLAHVVVAGRGYGVFWQLRGDATASDAMAAWAEITYTSHSLVEVL